MKKTGKKKDVPKLSDLEWEIMKPFWDQGPMAARDLFTALPQGHKWAYSTVKTILGRLVKKGVLTFKQIGNSYLYHPVYTRHQVAHKAMSSFTRRVLDGSLSPFLAYLAETHNLSSKEIKKLKDILNKYEANKEEKK